MESLLPWLLLLIVPGLWIVFTYNSLVNLRNQVALALATIDVQLKKRFDLIPNLVETVKGFAQHEREVLEDVTLARIHAAAPGTGWEAEENLQHAVGRLVARAEAYPDLKADSHFLMLQRQLSECEAQIAAARRTYNASVMDFNNSVEMFPSSIIAGLFGFSRKPEFEIAVAERKNPYVTL